MNGSCGKFRVSRVPHEVFRTRTERTVNSLKRIWMKSLQILSSGNCFVRLTDLTLTISFSVSFPETCDFFGRNACQSTDGAGARALTFC